MKTVLFMVITVSGVLALVDHTNNWSLTPICNFVFSLSALFGVAISN